MYSILNLMNFRVIVRLILNLICLAGLIYQTNILLTDFMSRATVVSIRVGPQIFDSLPGITICTEDFIGFGKLWQNYPDFRESYQNKTKELKKSNVKEAQKIDKIIEFYRHYIGNSINYTDIPAYNLIKNLTTNHKEIYFKLFVVGYVQHLDGRAPNYINSYENPDYLPFSADYYIESYSFLTDYGKKCFTYFSHLVKPWRNFKIKVVLLEFHTVYPHNLFPYNREMLKIFKFFIHSPNALPEYKPEHWIQIKSDQWTSIRFSQINTQLLGKGFDTNCHEYDLDYEKASYHLKTGCVTSCLTRYSLSKCSQDRIEGSSRLIPVKWFETNPKIKIHPQNKGSCISNLTRLYEPICERKCLDESQFKYYQYDIEKKSKKIKDWNPPIVEIRHNNLPDIIIKHIPKKTFISFV